MAKKRYPISKEFFPFDRFTFSLNPAFVALSQRFMGIPRFVWHDPSLDVKSHSMLGYQGGRMEVLVMRPNGIQAPAPCFVCIHGVGFVFDAAPSHYRMAMSYAKGAGCIVVFVRYRLAAEHHETHGTMHGFDAKTSAPTSKAIGVSKLVSVKLEDLKD